MYRKNKEARDLPTKQIKKTIKKKSLTKFNKYFALENINTLILSYKMLITFLKIFFTR